MEPTPPRLHAGPRTCRRPTQLRTATLPAAATNHGTSKHNRTAACIPIACKPPIPRRNKPRLRLSRRGRQRLGSPSTPPIR